MTNGTNTTSDGSTSRPNPAKASKAATSTSSLAPDGSFGAWFEENTKLLAVLVVVAVIAGLGYTGYQYLQRRQERAAQAAFYEVDSKFTKLKEGFERAKLQSLMPNVPPPANEKETPKAATGDLTKDYGTLVTDLEKVAQEYAGTSGGAQAALLAAETYLTYQQPDKAIALVQQSAQKLSSDHVLASLSKMLWGNALAVKGDCQSAIAQWQQVIDQKSAAFLHGDATLRAGMCLEQMNQPDRAAEMYRKVTTDAPDSAAGSTAKGLLRALEAKQPKKGA